MKYTVMLQSSYSGYQFYSYRTAFPELNINHSTTMQLNASTYSDITTISIFDSMLYSQHYATITIDSHTDSSGIQL